MVTKSAISPHWRHKSTTNIKDKLMRKTFINISFFRKSSACPCAQIANTYTCTFWIIRKHVYRDLSDFFCSQCLSHELMFWIWRREQKWAYVHIFKPTNRQTSPETLWPSQENHNWGYGFVKLFKVRISHYSPINLSNMKTDKGPETA